MTAPGAQRYTDLDLRVDPTLVGHATLYARQYLGEWDVMIAAREVALGTGTLPLPIARVVLNCARTDPRWHGSLPEPQSRTFTGAFPEQPGGEGTGQAAPGRPEPTERPRRPQRLRVVPDVPVRQPRDLSVTWKRRYGYSPGKGKRAQHKVWHVLDPARSRIRYWPEADDEANRYSTSVTWVCGPTPVTAVLLADPPMGNLALPMCATCQRYLEDPVSASTDHFKALQAWWLAEQERLTAPGGARAVEE